MRGCNNVVLKDQHQNYGKKYGTKWKIRNSTGAVRGSNGDDDDDGVWQVVDKNKRLRKSTGGTFESKTETQTVCRISKDQFKAMSVDDKLVSMFDMMAGFTSLNTRVHSIEQSMEAILVIMSDDHSDADTESTGTAQDEYSPAMERVSQLSQNLVAELRL